MDKVTYKDLNAFVSTIVTTALKKAKENFKKEKKDKQVNLNAFNRFCMLNVNKSSNDKDQQDAHVSINVDNNNNSNSK
eukprot:15329914-Ditylum_brightwellii.AAC.1